MFTAEFRPLPLITQAREINRKLKTVTLLDQDLARVVRAKLVEVGTETTHLDGSFAQVFFDLVNKIAQQMLILTDSHIKREFAQLHNLIKEFEPLFTSAPPDWRRGVVFGFIHGLTEPLVSVETPPSVKPHQSQLSESTIAAPATQGHQPYVTQLSPVTTLRRSPMGQG